MAEPDLKRGPRVVRIPVARPLLSALSVAAFGAALLVGGSTEKVPTVSARPTVPVQGAGTSAPTVAADWDVAPRDLVVGEHTDPLTVDQVVAGPVQIATLAASFQPGAVDSSSMSRRAGATDVPVILWTAYRSAVASAPSSCRLPVQLLAAIGQVESGSLAGRRLDSSHRVVPAVLGPVLNGGGFAAIFDTDNGRYDGDTMWDRAVGPMQFIPSTWQSWGRDGNADGARDPQNVEDSAFSAAAYLCANNRDLSTSAGLRSAILSYNHSDVYLADVLRLMKTVSPGGAVPRSVVTLPAVPFPVVGPPSQPPVRAAARPAGRSSATALRPYASGFPTTPARSTTTYTTARPTSAGTTTWTTTWTPTSSRTTSTSTWTQTSTPASTSASATSSSTTTTGTTTTGTTTTGTTPSTTTPSAASCPTPTTTDPAATSTTDVPTPASTTPSTTPSTTDSTMTESATSTATSSTSTGAQTPDPCATTPTDPPTSSSGLAAVVGSTS
ncbi:MAG: lytic transglycosylase domain-containing protein [Pedococcus sp.]